MTGSPRIDRLILVDALGIKVSGRETPDILDVFNTAPAEVRAAELARSCALGTRLQRHGRRGRSCAARAIGTRSAFMAGIPTCTTRASRTGSPRIAVPTLVLWGASDGIVAPSYGKAMRDLIPGARFALIDEAGHRPEIERPDAFVDAVTAFLEG